MARRKSPLACFAARSERGATLVEYVSMCSVFGLALISATNFTQESIEDQLYSAGDAIAFGVEGIGSTVVQSASSEQAAPSPNTHGSPGAPRPVGPTQGAPVVSRPPGSGNSSQGVAGWGVASSTAVMPADGGSTGTGGNPVPSMGCPTCETEVYDTHPGGSDFSGSEEDDGLEQGNPKEGEEEEGEEEQGGG